MVKTSILSLGVLWLQGCSLHAFCLSFTASSWGPLHYTTGHPFTSSVCSAVSPNYLHPKVACSVGQLALFSGTRSVLPNELKNYLQLLGTCGSLSRFRLISLSLYNLCLSLAHQMTDCTSWLPSNLRQFCLLPAFSTFLLPDRLMRPVPPRQEPHPD